MPGTERYKLIIGPPGPAEPLEFTSRDSMIAMFLHELAWRPSIPLLAQAEALTGISAIVSAVRIDAHTQRNRAFMRIWPNDDLVEIATPAFIRRAGEMMFGEDWMPVLVRTLRIDNQTLDRVFKGAGWMLMSRLTQELQLSENPS